MGIGKAFQDNPILVGCLGILFAISLICCSGALAIWFLADKAVETHSNAPSASITATIKKLQSRFSSDLLDKIHVEHK